MIKATERFANRVQNYIQFRPGYPQAIIEFLLTHCGLTDKPIVADVGSGTGILTEMFLRNGNLVHAVEPNCAMRQAGERLLKGYTNFISVAGSAEDTTLAEASVDFIAAGQAFHWFDRDKAKAEFKRVLRPDGWVVLVWNARRETSTPFSHAYEELLQTYATDYVQVNHKQIDNEIINEFFEGSLHLSTIENSQSLDFEGLKGRLLSSSYAPDAAHLQYSAMMAQLEKIFAVHNDGGTVVIEYDTTLYCGQFG